MPRRRTIVNPDISAAESELILVLFVIVFFLFLFHCPWPGKFMSITPGDEKGGDFSAFHEGDQNDLRRLKWGQRLESGSDETIHVHNPFAALDPEPSGPGNQNRNSEDDKRPWWIPKTPCHRRER
jgi:hypothetical protein